MKRLICRRIDFLILRLDVLRSAQRQREINPASQSIFMGFVRERIDYYRAKETEQRLINKIEKLKSYI